MRTTSLLDDARGLGPGDHVCWQYNETAEFHARIQDYLAEGLARGERVYYVGMDEPATLAADLRGIEEIDEALHRGAAEVHSIEQTYPVGGIADPAAQVKTYAAMTEKALAAGYTGLRVAAEATSLAEGTEKRAACARYEHLIDQYMVSHPFTALCGYDEQRLENESIAQLARLHPATNEGQESIPFRMYASSHPDCCATLTGEFDLSTAETFREALLSTDPQPVENELAVDATDVEFMDHRAMLMLAEHARDLGTNLVLHTDAEILRRLAQLLDASNLRVESTG